MDVRAHVIRLVQGQDIKTELEKFIKENQIKSGFIITCTGSITKVVLRLAAGKEGNLIKEIHDHFEILSLVGTLSPEGFHLHISLGDKNGNVIGGHLVSDAIVFTTAEIVVGEAVAHEFKRPFDSKTGFGELAISKVVVSKPAKKVPKSKL